MDQYLIPLAVALWAIPGVIAMVWHVFSWREVSLFDLLLALVAGSALGPILGICFLLNKVKLKGRP